MRKLSVLLTLLLVVLCTHVSYAWNFNGTDAKDVQFLYCIGDWNDNNYTTVNATKGSDNVWTAPFTIPANANKTYIKFKIKLTNADGSYTGTYGQGSNIAAPTTPNSGNWLNYDDTDTSFNQTNNVNTFYNFSNGKTYEFQIGNQTDSNSKESYRIILKEDDKWYFVGGHFNDSGWGSKNHPMTKDPSNSGYYYIDLTNATASNWFKFQCSNGSELHATNDDTTITPIKSFSSTAGVSTQGSQSGKNNNFLLDKDYSSVRIYINTNTTPAKVFAVAAPTISAGWYMYVNDGDGKLMSKYSSNAVDGTSIYYISGVPLKSTDKFYFERLDASGNVAEKVYGDNTSITDSKWAYGNASDKGTFYTRTIQNGKVYLRPGRMQVTVSSSDSFNPTLIEGYVPNVDNTVVWFAGEEAPYYADVKFVFYQYENTERKNATVVSAANYWYGQDYFYSGTVANLASYHHFEIEVTYNNEAGREDFYGKATDVSPTKTVKPSTAQGYDYNNRFGFIYGPAEWNGSNNVVYQSWITPKEFMNRYEAQGKKLYICGSTEIGGSGWEIQSPKEISLHNGVAYLETTISNDYTDQEASSIPQFKMSWMPYTDLVPNPYIENNNTQNRYDQKRAWATFNLGIMGGGKSEMKKKYEDNQWKNEWETRRAWFELSESKAYNGYSQANWSLSVGDAGKVAKGKYYLVVDTDKAYRSVTLLPFSPLVKMSNFEVVHSEPVAHTFAESEIKDHHLKGTSHATAYAVPDMVNDLTGTVHVTPAYADASVTDSDKEIIKNNYTINYYFYNCVHSDKDENSGTEAGFHDEDIELGRYYTDKSEGSTNPRLTEESVFSLRNLKPKGKPTVMLQVHYKFDRYTEGNSDNDAPGFRTLPVSIKAETNYTTVKPVLNEHLAFVQGFQEKAGDNEPWSIHFDLPFTIGATDFVHFAEYEITNVKEDYEPAHEDIPGIYEKDKTHWNWAIEGYKPYDGNAESGYSHDTHNWSKIMRDKGHINAVIHNYGTSFDNATKKVQDDGLQIVVRLKYPFKRYDENIIKYLGKASDLKSIPAMAKSEIMAMADEDDPYHIEYTVEEAAKDNGYHGNSDGIITGIENVAAEAEAAEAEYYTLQGVRVSAPLEPGVYVVRRGGNVTKEYVK